MKIIELTQNKFCLVDDEDYDFLSQWKWYAQASGNRFYAVRTDKHLNKKIIRMHRVIMNTPDGMDTDHIDGDGLNNQKRNLRVCTRSENNKNLSKFSTNTSGYKGVSFHRLRNKFQAKISVNSKTVSLGYFENPKDAADAYDKAAVHYYGKFSKLNS